MRQNAHVVNRSQFEQWLSKRAAGGAAAGAPAAGDAASGGSPAPDGKTIFTGAANCKACHTLADAGATGTVGPNLDQVVPDLSPAEVKESIVNPNAKITDGFSPGIMPGNFADTLGDDGVTAVVNYLKEVTKP
jgi:mono/diheme cytochrome c family protein